MAPEGDAEAKEAAGEPFGDFAQLTGIRFAEHAEGFTRIVFDFDESDGTVPWWRVEYDEGPFVGAGGPEVEVEGDAFLVVTLSSSGVDLSDAEPRETYSGDDRIEIDTATVAEMARVEDFEGVLVWVIGIRGGERPFTVDTLTGPPRVYIDVQG
jgi:hypothetical protein